MVAREPALDDDVLAGVAVVAVGEELDQGRLVGDDGVDEAGVVLREREGGHGGAAGAEDGDRAARPVGVDVPDQGRDVVRARGQRRGGVRVVDRAAADPAGVGGEHRVVDGEQVGEARERVGAHGRAEQHHERAVAPDLVVEPGAGDVEGGGEGVHGCPPG